MTAERPIFVEPTNHYSRLIFPPPDQPLWPPPSRSEAVNRFFAVVNTGPSLPDPYDLSLEELDDLLDPETQVGRETLRQDRLRLAIKTLGAQPADESHLREVFKSVAEKIITESVPRDWDGDPITAPILFGVTARQAHATAEKYGISDGRPKSLDEVAVRVGTDGLTAGKEVLETIRKMRQGEIVTVIQE